MRGRARLAVGVVLLLGWAPSFGLAARSGAGYELRPTRGIGPISIGERKSRVEHAVGRPTRRCGPTCVRTYEGPRGTLSVRYYRGRVVFIESRSGQIRLGGVPIRRGPKRLSRRLRRWRHFRCEGQRIYEHGGRPGAAIYFGQAKRVDIQVSASAMGGCGLQ